MKQLKIYYLDNKLYLALEENGIDKCVSTFTEDTDIINGFVDLEKVLSEDDPICLRMKR